MIKDLKGKYLSLWWDTPAKVHKIDEKISLVEKLKNEKRIETFRKQLHKLSYDYIFSIKRQISFRQSYK